MDVSESLDRATQAVHPVAEAASSSLRCKELFDKEDQDAMADWNCGAALPKHIAAGAKLRGDPGCAGR